MIAFLKLGNTASIQPGSLYNTNLYHKSPTGARPVAILQLASEVLEGRVSMHSNGKSGLHFRFILLTDA